MTEPVGGDGGGDGGGDVAHGDGRDRGDDRGRYRIVFEGALCIATGRCAEVSGNWTMDLERGVARPRSHFVDGEDLAHNLAAARVCPAKNGDGVIEVVDTATGETVDPASVLDG